MPELLVSVRSVSEARIAARAGVPFIDLKEPKLGSLGMPPSHVIRESVTAIREVNSSALISCACGEVVDEAKSSIDLTKLTGLRFLKIGLSQLVDRPRWQEFWKQRRDEFAVSLGIEATAQWIAVSYLDRVHAQSPAHDEVIPAAAATGCVGVLFDTFEKRNERFFDWMSETQLSTLSDRIHKAGMFCAAAGRLRLKDIKRLANSEIDIVAVRSAACDGDDRTAKVSEDRIYELLMCLDDKCVGVE